MKLEEIKSPKDVQKLNIKEQEELAKEIREKIISTVSKTGGHLASNLGVVELTIALHKVFDLKKDKVVWDVGHQTYVHKILTGRLDKFDTLRKMNGLAGFPKTEESEYDHFNTGHSSTSISVALGMARSRDLKKEKNSVIAVIGDGALTGGMALEALNDAGNSKTNLLVILNDNEMSISKNVGGVALMLSKLRTKKFYIKTNIGGKSIIGKIPIIGNKIVKIIQKFKKSVKQAIIPKMYFEDIGFRYLGPVDGHNLKQLEEILEISKELDGPVLLHVITKKGKGYKPAEDKPNKFHSTSSFDIETGEKLKKGKDNYSKIFGNKLICLAENNDKIVAITAAMEEGTGLEEFSKKFPNRFFDVGIAEQHAIGMAAGMAKEGFIPVIPIYSSFLQRGYDQLIHDVALQKLPVVICADRAGVVGADGETHQGMFDMSFTNLIPNFTIMAPKNFKELEDMLEFSVQLKTPVLIRYSRGGENNIWKKTKLIDTKIELGEFEKLENGKDFTIIAIGKMVARAYSVAQKLKEKGIYITVINARFLKPLNKEKIWQEIKQTKRVITIEDGTGIGGLGTAVEEIIAEHLCDLSEREIKEYSRFIFKKIAYPDEFIKQGTCSEIENKYGIDEDSIEKYIIDSLTENTKKKKGKVFKKTNIGNSDKEKNSLTNKIKLGGEKCLTAIQLKIKKKKTNS